MSQNGYSLILLAAFVLVVIFLLQWIWRRPSSDRLPIPHLGSGDTEVSPRSLMSPEEATLYNLITLAARDSLLVLAKVPILHILSLGDKDEEARKAVIRAIQPVRCDVILAHPGTLKAKTVVFFQRETPDASNRG